MRGVAMSGDNTIFIHIEEKLIRDLLSSYLDDENFNVLDAYQIGGDPKEKILDLRPDIVIEDYQNYYRNNFDTITSSNNDKFSTAFVVLGSFDSLPNPKNLISDGVKGVLLKNDDKDTLLKCLDAVSKGEFYFSSYLKHRYANKSQNGHSKAWLDQLTAREIEVLQEMVKLKSNKEIAKILSISYKTVKNHKYRICKKLNLSGRGELLRFVLKNKQELHPQGPE
jgi:DNA-binding NarL/FixJ family response regulator